MEQFYYNRIVGARIRSISMGVVPLLVLGILFYGVPYITGRFPDIILGGGVLIGGVLIVILVGKVAIGNVLHTDGETHVTYFRLGNFKLNRKQYNGEVVAVIEQDRERYYCLIIKIGNTDVKLERYPTRDRATERFEELNAFLRLGRS